MILFFEKIIIWVAVLAKLVLDLDAQFPNAFYADPLFVDFLTIDGQKQIGDQSCVYLDHESVSTSGDQMIDLQVTLPPGKKAFDFPSKLIRVSDLLGSQIPAVCGDPVIDAADVITHQANGSLGQGIVLISPQNDLGIIKNNAARLDIILPHHGFGSSGFDPDDEAFAFDLKRDKQVMVLIAPVTNAGLSGIKDLRDKGPFAGLAVGKMEFGGNASVDIEP